LANLWYDQGSYAYHHIPEQYDIFQRKVVEGEVVTTIDRPGTQPHY
jgi:hypothetical protein